MTLLCPFRPLRSLRPLLAILAALSIAGCSLFSKDNAPPTQVAFSLYAGPDVNPNPDSVVPDSAATTRETPELPAITIDPDAARGPYELNLKGANKADLTRQLKSLLDALQKDGDAHGARVRFRPATTSLGRLDSASTQPRYPLEAPATPLPVQWTLPKGASSAHVIVNPPLPIEGVGDTARSASKPEPALGQYADAPSFTRSRAQEQQEQERSESTAVATPVSFKILQLKDDTLFLSADYSQLTKDLKKTLGSTYIDDDDYVLQPGQFKYIEYAGIDKKARFIAVLANFHNQNGATWKQVLRLESRGYRYALAVILRGSEVTIADEGYRAPQPSK
ncbi:Type VI secretion lipoprotein [Caballeronia pedi]|uniref:Type VI secretion lipoprotein n=1 Tax=Caballeronia pedi TaxID=1777141 RepID=A0A158C0X1_9BURK|nr:type VI secretion system lipoprotein TssJ [Caballeronia pedi]SAK75998.1 Type VI secretion lipoprotein [Caballeronia pedi]